MQRLLWWTWWIPVVTLVVVEFYVRQFHAWGAWAAAPLFLVPFFMSVIITIFGALQLISELQGRSVRGVTILLSVVAVAPILWLLVRRYVL